MLNWKYNMEQDRYKLLMKAESLFHNYVSSYKETCRLHRLWYKLMPRSPYLSDYYVPATVFFPFVLLFSLLGEIVRDAARLEDIYKGQDTEISADESKVMSQVVVHAMSLWEDHLDYYPNYSLVLHHLTSNSEKLYVTLGNLNFVYSYRWNPEFWDEIEIGNEFPSVTTTEILDDIESFVRRSEGFIISQSSDEEALLSLSKSSVK